MEIYCDPIALLGTKSALPFCHKFLMASAGFAVTWLRYLHHQQHLFAKVPCGRIHRARCFSATWGDQEPPIFRPKTASKTRKGLELPDGWREITSPARGIYYAHDTGATQWDFPKGPPNQQEVLRAQNERSQRYGHRTQQLGPGATVRLYGLERHPQLEGKTGTCVQLDPDGYVRVRLATGELKAVKMKNLMLVEPPPSTTSTRPTPRPPPERNSDVPSKATWLKWPFLGVTTVTTVLVLFQYYQLSEHDDGATHVEGPRDAGTKVATSPPVVPAVALPALPQGWCEHLDPVTGRLYYWKEADPTNTVTWQRPERWETKKMAASFGSLDFFEISMENTI